MAEAIAPKKGGFNVFTPPLYDAPRRRDADQDLRLLDSLMEGILTTDHLGRIRQINMTMAGLLGYSSEEIIDQNVTAYLNDPEAKIFRRLLTLSGKRRPFRREFVILRKDGSRLHTMMQISSLKADNDHFAGFLISAIDITRHKNIEELLRKTEEKYRNIFENAIDGIFQISPDGRIISANPALARIFGYASPREFIGAIRHFGKQLYVDAGRYQTLKMLLQQQDMVHDFEFRARHKSGSEIWACENVRAVRNQAGQLLHYEGILRDITARKDLEDQLLQAQKMEAIGRLAGGIAHDFNNILTTVIGNAELALHQLTHQSPVQKRIQIIVDTAERAAQLTRHLLTISRKQVVSPVIIDVNDAVDSVAKILDRLMGEDVRCEIFRDGDIHPIRADACQIEQVVLNLAVNAREAMPNGGKLTISTAMVRLDQDYCRQHPDVSCGDYAMISVSDTGVGISGSSLEHIFEPFYTTKAAGTGLGLSIVYGIVKQCGGHVTIASTVGSGSTFNVFFPRVLELEGHSEPSPPAHQGVMPSGKETILVAEDEASIRELICDVLRECGYTVHAVATAEEALRQYDCDGTRIDLLISDVILPGKRGPDLAEGLKTRHPNMKVMFISGYSDDRIRHSDILEGRAHFLPKPFTPLSLANTVREILEPNRVSREGDCPAVEAPRAKEA